MIDLRKYVSVAVALLAGVFIGRYVIPTETGTALPFQLLVSAEGQRQFVFPTFWEAWDALHEHYIGKVDDKDLFYGAVAGMVRAVGDPYTVFEDPDNSKQFRETLDGQFPGIGIEIGARGGLVRVIAPLAGSPAQKAGVLAGDIVVAVNKKPVTPEMTIDEVVRSIRGPKGEAVVLTIAREEGGKAATHDISVVRDTITVESVSLDQLAHGIAHIKISSFNADTAQQFAAVAKRLKANPPAGIVLDVRNNPGGFLQTAVDIAGYFFDPGTLVVTEKGDKQTPHVTKGYSQLRDIPVVVLINKGSASASEILAGALLDNRTVPVVGDKSFGKGSVQELISLQDGSSLRVTVAKWFTPSGRSISDEGIEPTVAVADKPDTDSDEQLEAALKALHP